MDEEQELVNAIRTVLQRFNMDREEFKEEGLPQGLFEILKTQTYLPVDSIKDDWLQEEKLYKELGAVKDSDENDFYSDQDFYLPSDELMDRVFDE
ncbi:MAG: hypothetical protein ABEJ87_05990 [Candidatus Nanohalobium sp.]